MAPFLSTYRTPPTKAPVAARTAPLVNAPAAVAAPRATAPIGRLDGETLSLAPPPADPVRPDLAPKFKVMSKVADKAVEAQRQKIADLEQRLARTSSYEERGALEQELAAAKRELAALERLAKAVKRAEANPATTEAEAEQLNQLVLQATGRVTGSSRLRLLAAAEALVRDIGRTPPSDPGLNAEIAKLAQLQGRHLDDLSIMRGLLRGAGGGKAGMQLQLEIGFLERALAVVDRAKAALEQIADDKKAKPEVVAEAKKLAEAFRNATDPGQREKIAYQLERLASSGRAPWRDLTIESRGVAVTDAINHVDAQLADLMSEFQRTPSAEKQQLILLKMEDLRMKRAALVRIRELGGVLADARGLPDATRKRVAELLEQARNTQDLSRLAAIANELERLVPRRPIGIEVAAAKAPAGRA